MRLQERMVRLARIGNVLILITPRRVVCSNLSKEQGVVKKTSGRQSLIQVPLDGIVKSLPYTIAEPESGG
jgi:hypothetical protein